MNKKNVVIFGGGNGTSLLARALFPFFEIYNLEAIVSVSDSGRSSAKLRDEVGTLPLADILRVICAFSSYDYNLVKELLYRNRFCINKKMKGLNIGSLFLGLATKYTGDVIEVVRELESVLKCVGNVHPATLQKNDLLAKLNTGEIIKGEGEIDRPNSFKKSLIENIWLEPDVNINENAKKSIGKADVIITGPGDLYTSNIASFLAIGTKETIQKSNAKIIYVASNKYTIGGELAPINLSERVRALEKYIGKNVHTILWNNHKHNKEEKDFYKEKKWGFINNDVGEDNRIIVKDFEDIGGGISTQKLGNILNNII